MKLVKVCTVCGNTKKVCNTNIGLLCGKHYLQYIRYGKVLNRTKYDSNEIRIKDDHAVMVLYNYKSEPVAEVLIDIEDINKVKPYKWCVDKNNYVKNSKQEYLHRFIMNTTTLYVDHINGNKLDNRKANLRICSNADNSKNRVKLPSNNKSGIIGVRFRKDRNKWYAELKADGIVHRLGSYSTKEEAIQARINGEINYFGEFKSKVL